MKWIVDVSADPDPGPNVWPEPVPDHIAHQEFTDEQEATRAAKGAAVPGWFVTVTEPNGERWGL